MHPRKHRKPLSPGWNQLLSRQNLAPLITRGRNVTERFRSFNRRYDCDKEYDEKYSTRISLPRLLPEKRRRRKFLRNVPLTPHIFEPRKRDTWPSSIHPPPSNHRPCTASPPKLVKEPFVWLTLPLLVCYYTARYYYRLDSATGVHSRVTPLYDRVRERGRERERGGERPVSIRTL